jgi:hypothetical protein
MSAPDSVLKAAEARESARAAVRVAVGIDPNVTLARTADGRTVRLVAFHASTATYAYRARRYNGVTAHDVNGGPIGPAHRKARALAARVDAAGEAIDAYLAAYVAADDAAAEWRAATSYAVLDAAGAVVELHATARGAEIGAARHPGATIRPPEQPDA